ncbi:MULTISPECIES: DUF751 family protein [Prochlorococcus]|uniref:DUF751 family protein n=1 Tax=Prochlorococcus TaxID=1218 RepID=UPI00053377AA|nr:MULTISPECIES: DUF751 family protein [Prochlorococcus]KGG13264.1 Expressed protein possibly involved in photorespiration [Prochlorococcus sp. MIT 0601]
MGEFFSNVFRYPKYLITIVLGIFTAFLEPLIQRSKNPITAIALIGACISIILTFYFVVKAMVLPDTLV